MTDRIERRIGIVLLALILATQVAMVVIASTALDRIRSVEREIDQVCQIVKQIAPTQDPGGFVFNRCS